MPTRRLLDRDETRVHDDLVRMWEFADRAIERALDCLHRQDRGLAQAVVDDDAEMNQLERKVEDECLVTVATQQPAAHDLRELMASVHIAVELERIADLAADVAKMVLCMDDQAPAEAEPDIDAMGERCRNMLAQVLDAYEKRDADAAFAIAAEDDALDQLDRQVVDGLLKRMSAGPDTTLRDSHLLWAAHNLERIGDRVTNIAERVIFIITGRYVELND